jgi:3-ketosteroid 9alpha-monooxygenase subunit B
VSGPPRWVTVPVARVVEETADARSFVLAEPLPYKAGQFVTVRIPDGSSRCYSFSSAPQTDELPKFTVKRMPNGKVSNWLCDNTPAALELLPPAGSFTRPDPAEPALFLAGGSGITPIMSLIKEALSVHGGPLFLLYANRDAANVIFADELRRMPDRLTVAHWYGPPTADDVRNLVRGVEDRETYICGPEPFLDVAAAALSPDRIHVERFLAVASTDAGSESSTVEVMIDGAVHTLPWPADRRLLEVVEDAGLNPPFSCRQGNCSACACRLVEGEVTLVHNEVLEDEDFAEGWTLACQALPKSPLIRVTYD